MLLMVALPTPPTLLEAFEKTLFGGPTPPGSGPYVRPYETWYEFFYDLTNSPGTSWRRMSVRCENTQSTDTGDDAYFTLDLVNYTNGIVDDTWTDQDYTTAWNAIAIILNAWAVYMTPVGFFSSGSAYRMEFNPAYHLDPATGKPPKGVSPFLPSNGPENTHPFAIAGVETGSASAAQTAFSITELVPVRKHWGRFYLPYPGATIITTEQQFADSVVDSLASSVHDAYLTLSNAQLFPVVVQTQNGKVADMALLQVTGIQVDSNPDVIRRRRKKHSSHKKVMPVAA